MKKPQKAEYDPRYQRYVDLVANGNLLHTLRQNTEDTAQFFDSISSTKYNYRYAENKWSIKDILMHLIDTERGFSYRAIVCVRGDDKTPLHPMDEELFASNVDVSGRTMKSLLDEFLTVRKGFQAIFENITDEQGNYFGNGISHKINAKSLGYIAVGHAIHHVEVIKERYL